MGKIEKRDPKKFKCGQGLTSLKSFTVRDKSVDEIMSAMGHAGLAAREMSKGTDILTKAINDPDCKVVLTLSGIVTVSKMGELICEMIDAGWVDCIIATGALIAHGTVEGRGGTHYKYDPSISDEILYKEGYDRIYDTLELESNLDNLDDELAEVWDILFSQYKTFGSYDFCKETGKALEKKFPLFNSILKSAHLHDVPVFIPAFTDSELALDAFTHSVRTKVDTGLTLDQALASVPSINFNPFNDLLRYLNFTRNAKKLAILTLGGGVPRNYGQQVMPLIDILINRLEGTEAGKEIALKKFTYGVRICPDPPTLGGLSGCTYSEGISWGKFASKEEGGEFAEIHADYTIVLPWMIKSLQERLTPSK